MRILSCLLAIFLLTATTGCSAKKNTNWVVDSQADWEAFTAEQSQIQLAEGMAVPTAEIATLRSKIKTFDSKRSAKSLRFEQSSVWQNWQPIENLGPSNLNDAPVLLSLGPDNYWLLGRYGDGRKRGDKAPLAPFVAEPTTLEGFEDVQLMTTRFANQYDAPGGLEKGLGGYHAWQSKDMVNWVHHGPVTDRKAKWTTTAEYADGKAYIYYDFPNDQDPHVFVDDNLFDGKPGEDVGLAFKDPSDGSDIAMIRDLDGNFHVIYEDWSPIKARVRSWDSPLAGHAVSPDGLGNFEIKEPAVDHRTTPTGEFDTYTHPHWKREDPQNFPSNVATYEIHKPEQPAYGDWAAISIGGRYYLFGDYDAHRGGTMSTAWFTSETIDGPFLKCDNIGEGHPDPDVCFAEGQFYLATQQTTDFVSPGPWVESVEARVGVDTDNNGSIDEWTPWQAVKETYDHIPGFAKQIAKTPASLDLSSLPAGYGFAFELKLTYTTQNKSKPILDRVELKF